MDSTSTGGRPFGDGPGARRGERRAGCASRPRAAKPRRRAAVRADGAPASALVVLAGVLATGALLGACAAHAPAADPAGTAGAAPRTEHWMEQVPAELAAEPIRTTYDGTSDDLLTGGLGLAGLRGAPPGFADPLRPTARELRRRAIWTAYRGLVDVTEAGGFGRLYGPVDDLRVAGIEYLVAIRTPEGAGTTTALLQLPNAFDWRNPCLLAVASSGSRGIYGALPTAAEWGLRRGCAVVHTDKGTGIGVWDVGRGLGYRIDGTTTRDPEDPLLTFAPPVLGGLEEVAAQSPHAMLFKHAHSGLNPESDWGTYLLQAIRVAFELLNAERPRATRRAALAPADTLVLAAGISNGGAVVLRALERDRAGWIDGAIASEPNVIVHGRTTGLAIESGGRRVRDAGVALYEYTGLHYLYQPCAVLAEPDPAAPFRAQTEAVRPRLEQWCRELQSLGLLPSGALPAATANARQRLLDAGMLPEGLRLGHFNVALGLWPALTATYAWAYSRLPYWEPPCGVGFAPTGADGRPRPLDDEESARLWADGSGIAPTGGVSLVERGPDGGLRAANEGSTRLAVCYAPDWLATPEIRARAGLPAELDELRARVREGQDEVVMSAQPGNRPVIVVHGRADSLIPVNHTSRAYYGVNRRDRGERDELRYYELVHGQHFDAFLGLPGFADGYVPMQPWLLRGLDLLHARLTRGTPLPPSQVVRTRPRAAGEALASGHLGELRASAGADAIGFDDGVLSVPE